MFGPLLIVIGILFLLLTLVLYRLGAPERSLFRNAVKVTGEVVEVLSPSAPSLPETARIQFAYRDRQYVVETSPEWDGGSWGAGYSVKDAVRLLVPPSCPQRARPAVDIRNTVVGGPGVVAVLGVASLGFGTLILTGSVLAGSVLVVVAGVGMVAFLLYARYW